MGLCPSPMPDLSSSPGAMKLCDGRYQLGALMRRGATGYLFRGRWCDPADLTASSSSTTGPSPAPRDAVIKLERARAVKRQMHREWRAYAALKQLLERVDGAVSVTEDSDSAGLLGALARVGGFPVCRFDVVTIRRGALRSHARQVRAETLTRKWCLDAFSSRAVTSQSFFNL